MKLRRTIAAVLLSMVAACGGEPGLQQATADLRETPDLAERQALRLSSQVTATHRETGERTTTVTEIFAIADVAQNGADVSMQISPCRFSLPPLDGWDARIDEAFLRDPERVAPLTIGGSISTTEDAAQLITTPATFLLGVSDLGGSALPSRPDDPRVIDQDEDGKPGVSVHMSLGRVFVAIAADIALDGDVDDSGEVRGQADIALAQAVYGDSIWLVDAAELAAEQEASHDFDSSSSFALAPLHPHDGCDEVLARFRP